MREREDLRLPADACGIAGRGRAGEPQAGGAPDAEDRDRARDTQALQGLHDEQGSRGKGCSGPSEPRFLGRWAGLALGRRHHVRAYLDRLALPRGRGGRLEPLGRRLVDGEADANPAG